MAFFIKNITQISVLILADQFSNYSILHIPYIIILNLFLNSLN